MLGKWSHSIKLWSHFNVSITSYHCEEVLVLHNKPHPPPPIVPNDTKVGRCNKSFRWQHLEVVTEPYSVCQFCGGGHTRDLCGKTERGRRINEGWCILTINSYCVFATLQVVKAWEQYASLASNHLQVSAYLHHPSFILLPLSHCRWVNQFDAWTCTLNCVWWCGRKLAKMRKKLSRSSPHSSELYSLIWIWNNKLSVVMAIPFFSDMYIYIYIFV